LIRPTRQALDDRVDPRAGLVVPAAHAVGVDVGVADHQDRLVHVVEDDHRVVEAEQQVGQAAIVGRGVR
jgi:hypothetical protein